MYDVLTVAAIVDELNSLLIGARLQQVIHVDALTLAFEVYSPPRRRWLVLSADHRFARVVISDTRVNGDAERVTPLLLLLRKYARGGRIVSVSQPHNERIIRLSIAKALYANNPDEGAAIQSGEADDPEAELADVPLEHSELVVEIMGRRSNIIMLDDTGRIRDAVKRVTPEMSRARTVLPGRMYTPPPAQQKQSPQTVEANAVLSSAAGSDTPLARWLVERFGGVSPLLAREVAFRAGLEPSTRAGDLQADAAHRIVEALGSVFEPLKTGEWQPMVYTLPDDVILFAPQRLYAIESEAGMTARPATSMSAAVLEALRLAPEAAAETPGRHAARRDRLVAEIDEARARVGARLASLGEQEAQAEEAETWRRKGEAIYTVFNSIRPGASEVQTEDGLRIELDPTLSASENAQHYFERYRKAQSANEHLPKLIDTARQQLAYLDQLLLMARQAETYDEIESVRLEWQSWSQSTQGVGRASLPRGARPAAAARRPRVYHTAGGDTILLGRTGQQNDTVTFDLAGPTDLWLHARNMPGAHVILRRTTSSDDGEVEQAASLAAWYSDGRGSTTVPVDVTERRYVRKIKGAGPGMVTYRNERTLNVRPRSEKDLGLT